VDGSVDGKRWLTFDSTPESMRPSASELNPIQLYFAALSDSMTFFWDRYVLTFGLGDQIALFSDAMTWAGTTIGSLRDNLNPDFRGILSRRFGETFVVIVAAGLAVMMLLRRRRRLFDSLAAYLAAQGIEVGPAMTMEEALRELRIRHPEAAEELQPLIALYEEETFGGKRDSRRARTIRRKLAELRT